VPSVYSAMLLELRFGHQGATDLLCLHGDKMFSISLAILIIFLILKCLWCVVVLGSNIAKDVESSCWLNTRIYDSSNCLLLLIYILCSIAGGVGCKYIFFNLILPSMHWVIDCSIFSHYNWFKPVYSEDRLLFIVKLVSTHLHVSEQCITYHLGSNGNIEGSL